jgi:hypothetical protein
MVEEVFKKLGFIINNETVESSGSETDWHYYTLDIGDICVMSNASDETEDDDWYATIFEACSFRITDETDLSNLIEILRKNTPADDDSDD